MTKKFTLNLIFLIALILSFESMTSKNSRRKSWRERRNARRNPPPVKHNEVTKADYGSGFKMGPYVALELKDHTCMTFEGHRVFPSPCKYTDNQLFAQLIITVDRKGHVFFMNRQNKYCLTIGKGDIISAQPLHQGNQYWVKSMNMRLADGRIKIAPEIGQIRCLKKSGNKYVLDSRYCDAENQAFIFRRR